MDLVAGLEVPDIPLRGRKVQLGLVHGPVPRHEDGRHILKLAVHEAGVRAGHQDAVVLDGEAEEEILEPVGELLGQAPHGLGGGEIPGDAAEQLHGQQLREHDDIGIVVIADIHIVLHLFGEGGEVGHGTQAVLDAADAHGAGEKRGGGRETHVASWTGTVRVPAR